MKRRSNFLNASPRARQFMREIMLAAAITVAAVIVFLSSRTATETVAVHQDPVPAALTE